MICVRQGKLHIAFLEDVPMQCAAVGLISFARPFSAQFRLQVQVFSIRTAGCCTRNLCSTLAEKLATLERPPLRLAIRATLPPQSSSL